MNRRGFFKAIGTAVLGMSLALRSPEKFEVQGADEGLYWKVSKDGGRTWSNVRYDCAQDVAPGDIVQFIAYQSHPWRVTYSQLS